MKKTIIITAISLIALAIGLGLWIMSVVTNTHHGEDIRFYVPRGSTSEALSDTLRAALGEDLGNDIALLWKWQSGKPKTAEGSYVAKAGMTAFEISRILLHGHQTPVRLTFNNLRTLPQLAERVSETLEISPESFLLTCDSILPTKGYAKEEFVAAFMPDTYEFYWNAKPETVVERLAMYRDKWWTPERTQSAKDMGLTPIEAATIASIAEEETIKGDEIGKVGRLYVNRLDRQMPLQADPTVKFAIGDFTLRRILKKHLDTPSPYNTYLHPGLPPGPIRIASPRAIDALLQSQKHPYIYMCAKEDFSGYHNFSSSFNEHQANAARYQAALNRKGIK